VEDVTVTRTLSRLAVSLGVSLMPIALAAAKALAYWDPRWNPGSSHFGVE
jgi:hypothetical protein